MRRTWPGWRTGVENLIHHIGIVKKSGVRALLSALIVSKPIRTANWLCVAAGSRGRRSPLCHRRNIGSKGVREPWSLADAVLDARGRAGAVPPSLRG